MYFEKCRTVGFAIGLVIILAIGCGDDTEPSNNAAANNTTANNGSNVTTPDMGEEMGAVDMGSVDMGSVDMGSVDMGDDEDSSLDPVQIDPDRVANYIKPAPYTTVRLEVDVVSGREPVSDVVDELVVRLEPVLEKSVVVDMQVELEPGPDVWSFEELRKVAAAQYDGPTHGEEVVIHVLIVNGSYGESTSDAMVSNTLGLAWSNRNVVLFADALADACTPDNNEELRRRGLVERACNATFTGTWLHEIGHVIGLVDNGLPMVEPHADPDHPAHDDDPESIMYWAFDVANVFDQVRGKILEDEDPIPPFSDACLADIEALRNQP